jgi:hypothetical protein
VKTPQLKFGDTVCWYRGASRSNAPQLATVYHCHTEPTGRVSLTVAVLVKDSERVQWFSGVHHVDDPVYEERPRGANMAKSNGGFEYVDEFYKRLAEAEKQRQERIEMERLEREEKAELAARAASKETVKV